MPTKCKMTRVAKCKFPNVCLCFAIVAEDNSKRIPLKPGAFLGFGSFDLGKNMFLVDFDMYSVVLAIFNQYLSIFAQYLAIVSLQCQCIVLVISLYCTCNVLVMSFQRSCNVCRVLVIQPCWLTYASMTTLLSLLVLP